MSLEIPIPGTYVAESAAMFPHVGRRAWRSVLSIGLWPPGVSVGRQVCFGIDKKTDPKWSLVSGFYVTLSRWGWGESHSWYDRAFCEYHLGFLVVLIIRRSCPKCLDEQ